SLVLPNSQLMGSISTDLCYLEHLLHLDISNNFFNGSLPASIFNSSQLQVLSLSSNAISGELPESIGGMRSLQFLNLSGNALTGKVPENVMALQNLTVVSLRANYLSGMVPSGFSSVWVLDLSSNLLYGTLPLDFGGNNLRYLNLSYNNLTGPISIEFAHNIPHNATIDLSFNNLTGAIPESLALLDQKPESFFGNVDLCEEMVTKSVQESCKPATWSCLTLKGEETSDATTSESEHEKEGMLVAVDGEPPLEVETLLKATAYVLGSSGTSIVYKAVLEDGTALAVRRIGESGVERLKDFESQVRVIARLKHPNLVRVRGFYWGGDEKLVIYDYVNNGSLASYTYKKPSSLPFQIRVKIARGVARGVAYIHEKKHVHGNIKPTNILLNSDMEPIITDFGLNRLASYSAASTSLYQAPESLKNVKLNPKWDVYSFGIVLLELLTGRVFSDRELGQWTGGSVSEEKNRALRLADVGIRADMEAREDDMLTLFKLGFNCASSVAQRRRSMKEALHILEKISTTTT
ncbi:Pkinase domain-containing protein/LRR_1 domain-containing protein/LRR_4 domain-containing protein, partial [Cephalotus follicularis]